MAGQVYAVASGKGGVGKTTTVVNLGVVLRRADHTVALVDADLGMANLGTMLGVDGEATLHDVLAGEVGVEEAVVEEAPGFGVLAGSPDLTSYPDADPRELRGVLETLAESYDYVLVDTGAGMSHEDVLPLGLADQVLLVTTPEPAAIGDTRKTADLADLAAGDLAGLVVTMADEATDAKYVASQVGVELLGVIPFDATVRKSTASATPLEGLDPDSPAATAYRELAARIADDAVEPETRAPTAEPTAGRGTADTADGPSDGGATRATDAVGGDVGSNEPVDAGNAEDAIEVDANDAHEAADVEPTDEPTDAEAAIDPSADAVDEAGTPADDAEAVDGEDAADAEEAEDYLEEFEDDEPASGGLFSKLTRLFR